MTVRASLNAAVHHRMRVYYLPLAAGLLLVVSAFLPWILVDEISLGGVPGITGFWVLALGMLAAVLASLSIITRKNSRHPLLIVGLTAFSILFLTGKFIGRSASDKVWAVTQARAIVDGVPVPTQVRPTFGSGSYVGLTASGFIVIFGLTVVFRRVSKLYVESEDDDV